MTSDHLTTPETCSHHWYELDQKTRNGLTSKTMHVRCCKCRLTEAHWPFEARRAVCAAPLSLTATKETDPS
jgi:hypothetical protein